MQDIGNLRPQALHRVLGPSGPRRHSGALVVLHHAQMNSVRRVAFRRFEILSDGLGV